MSSAVAIPCITIDELRESNKGKDSALFARLDEAFGLDGPGVVCVDGSSIRSGVRNIRDTLLPQAVSLTALPQESRDKLVDPDTPLTNGLSRGTEVTDKAKSSFYYHPEVDAPGEHLPAGAQHVPLFHNPNLFPTDAEMPGFKAAARDAAQFVVGIGHELAQLIDRRLQQVPGYAAGTFGNAVRYGPTSNHKCRLIQYHPYETPEEVKQTGQMWAAAHLDTGSLTGLVPGVFVNAEGAATPNPYPEAGLYILDRKGSPLKAELPPGAGDVLLFQVGEALQIVSGGTFVATPHFVQGPGSPDPAGPSRVALAVFMQPQPHEDLPVPGSMTYEEVAERGSDRHLPKEWPSLSWRFKKLREEGLLAEGKPLTFGSHGYITFSNLGAVDVG